MSTADLIKGGAQALGAGQSLDSNTIGDVAGANAGDISSATVDVEGVFRADESTVDDDKNLPGSTDTQVADSKSSKPEAKASPGQDKPKTETSAKEVITISDEKGRRQVEIDWENKEQLKKYVQMAFGARKWQAERDQAKQSASKLQEENGSYKDNWQKLEQAYKGGVAGLVDFLEGQGSYANHIKKELAKAEFIRNASPEELEGLKSRERVEKLERELASERQEREKFTKEITSEREAAEMAQAQSKVYPVFNKYRFTDKLGDAHDEHMFDEMLWNTSIKRLEAYEEQGLDVSPELVEREIRSVAQSIRKRIGNIAEKRASQVVEQKKKEATENVQQRVMSGYKTGGNAKEARELLDQGNTSALLKNWSKYGSLFGGNRK